MSRKLACFGAVTVFFTVTAGRWLETGLFQQRNGVFHCYSGKMVGNWPVSAL
ncbi:hypothetical protein [Paenibacillus sp. Soil750]|uniref:hypothetical protein n=1 Tax=Paenibacillus sp. Soil750 TaxID=1736398 RepID=UPI0012F77F9A|nr:hypothetical protein [Paenibacillus sp. Soil750]